MYADAGPVCSGDDNRFAAQCDTGPEQLVECIARGIGRDAGGVVEQAPYREARVRSVRCGGLHTVDSRDADAIEFGDGAVFQPGGQRRTVLGDALEAALRGGVRALEEDLVDVSGLDGGRETRMELASLAADGAMQGERVLEVGALGEVGAQVDVVVTRGDDDAVLSTRRWISSAMAASRSAPPFTGILPPSQKPFAHRPRSVRGACKPLSSGELLSDVHRPSDGCACRSPDVHPIGWLMHHRRLTPSVAPAAD